MLEDQIKLKIREIPEWPKPGVNFKDITPLLADGKLFKKVIDAMAKPYLNKKIDKVVGIDARGFILAAAIAYRLKCGLSIVRKKGKLPWKTISQNYALEYGSSVIEMHRDAILPGERILMVDDVLATGGTMRAAINMVKKLRGRIMGIEFLTDLTFLSGGKVLKKILGNKVKINALVKY